MLSRFIFVLSQLQTDGRRYFVLSRLIFVLPQLLANGRQYFVLNRAYFCSFTAASRPDRGGDGVFGPSQKIREAQRGGREF